MVLKSTLWRVGACYARPHGLTRNKLRYFLDLSAVFGEDFPGDTFRLLKEKEIKQSREYPTRRLVSGWVRIYVNDLGAL